MIVAHDELETGHSYSISRQTPLMPELNPKDVFKAIDATIVLPARSIVEIVGRATRGNSIWYEVASICERGWINSTALIGQTVTHVIESD